MTVIVVQRVRVRWGAASRGAPHANLRRGLEQPFPLPSSGEESDAVVHDVLLDEVNGYAPSERVLRGGINLAAEADVCVRAERDAVSVGRGRTWMAFPRHGGPTRLFVLRPGEVGRHRANFRITGCACNPSWYFESQLVHVSNGEVGQDAFLRNAPTHDVDDRVHLYGGRRRSPAERRHR
ncbi:hypothetical protein ACQPZJ_20480 [Actinoplanes sp. CA-054009]